MLNHRALAEVFPRQNGNELTAAHSPEDLRALHLGRAELYLATATGVSKGVMPEANLSYLGVTVTPGNASEVIQQIIDTYPELEEAV